MDVERVRKLRDELCKDFKERLLAFERDTGMKVRNLFVGPDFGMRFDVVLPAPSTDQPFMITVEMETVPHGTPPSSTAAENTDFADKLRKASTTGGARFVKNSSDHSTVKLKVGSYEPAEVKLSEEILPPPSYAEASKEWADFCRDIRTASAGSNTLTPDELARRDK